MLKQLSIHDVPKEEVPEYDDDFIMGEKEFFEKDEDEEIDIENYNH